MKTENMEREIKFRVWNPRYKEFNYWGFLEGTFTGIPTGAGLTIEECRRKSEQYTGLKDRNGVEIYEGDILKNKYGVLWIVEGLGFVENVYTFIMHYHNDRKYAADKSFEQTEIIGNIYETPELLNKD